MVGQASDVTQPLALFLYEKLLPGGQLTNRLQDLGYRVHTISKPEELVGVAELEKPLLVVVDLDPRPEKVCAAITRLKQNPNTLHLPVVAFTGNSVPEPIHTSARNAGATLIVSDSAILAHLDLLLDRALQVD